MGLAQTGQRHLSPDARGCEWVVCSQDEEQISWQLWSLRRGKEGMSTSSSRLLPHFIFVQDCENKLLLVSLSQFVLICYDFYRKQIQLVRFLSKQGNYPWFD